MMTAITRAVSPSMETCELTFLKREAIDMARAGDWLWPRGIPVKGKWCKYRRARPLVPGLSDEQTGRVFRVENGRIINWLRDIR
jgi:hypothetical protein